MDFTERTFSPADYVIFATMLAASAAIGFFFAIKDRGKQSTEEYLLAGRSMSPVPVAFSLTVSFMSAILVLGTPSEIYSYGSMYLWFLLSCAIVMVIVMEIYIPVFYRMKLSSVYEYLGKRFNAFVRVEGTLLYLAQTVLYIGIVIYAPALALNAVTGFNLWAAVVSTGLVCILYSSLGGLKAVVWTDAIQAVIMVVGFLSIMIRGCVIMGGIENVWRICEDGGRIEFFKFDLDPRERHTVWSVTFGGTFLFLSLYGANQGQVQRYLSCRSVADAKKAIIINLFGLWVLNACAGLTGLILYAYYSECDPLSLGLVSKPDQLLPYMVLDIFQNSPGMPGVFLACVYSGSLSTVSTAIIAMASVTIEDFLKPRLSWSEKSYALLSRGLVVFYGGLAMFFAYLTSTLGAILQAAISVLGLVGGPIVGLYTLGILFPFANSLGALVGMNVGLVANIWVFVGSRAYPPHPDFLDRLPLSTSGCLVESFSNSSTSTTVLATTPAASTSGTPQRPPVADLYSLSYMLYAPFGFCWTLVVGLTVSLLSGGYNARGDVDSALICSFFDHRMFRGLPLRFREVMRCGVDRSGSKERGGGSLKNIYKKSDSGSGGGADNPRFMGDGDGFEEIRL